VSGVRLVLDTNVLVSALLHPGRTPDRAIEAALRRGARILIDARIEAEYRTVLARPKLASIPVARRDALLERVLQASVLVEAEPDRRPLIDAEDRMFVEVALSGAADAIVTGNLKHYPSDLGVEVIGPRALMDRLEEPPTE
jgi:putative PIN family toxin of toxin-antitoxin system